MFNKWRERFKKYDPAGQALAVGSVGAGVVGWKDFGSMISKRKEARLAGLDTAVLEKTLTQQMIYKQLPITMALGGGYMAIKQGILPDTMDYIRSAGRDQTAKRNIRQDLQNTAIWEGAVVAGFTGTHYAVEKAHRLLADIPYFKENLGERVESALSKYIGESWAKSVTAIGRESLTPAAITFAAAPFVTGPVLSLAGKAIAFFNQHIASNAPPPQLQSQEDEDSQGEQAAEQSLARAGLMSVDDIALNVSRQSASANAQLVARSLSARL